MEGVCTPFGDLVAGDISLDQDKDCVSYIREENELVLVLVCFMFSSRSRNPCTLCQI